MKVTILFEPHFTNCVPIVNVQTSVDSQQITVDHAAAYTVELSTAHTDLLCVDFVNKCDVDDNWIEIKKVELDDIDLQHFIFNGRFYPRYNPDWFAKQNPPPPMFYCPGTQIRLGGQWQLPIKTPVYKTVLDFWIDDER